MHLKLILFFLISFGSMAHEVHILGRLLPVGSFEINSDKLYGDFVLLKDKGTINSKKLSVRTTSLETGIQLRDEHLHKYLNANKHPRIFIKDVIIKNFKGSGNLTINGVSKKLSFQVTSDKTHYLAKFTLIPSQFKLQPASFMGVSVEDNIELTIKVLKQEILPK
ncbi:MAG: YceI family protein [Deltaproteobacteria bacterium]|nr:MAG: YceI family protein [Deltaproteobacteria bacterium]